MININWSTLLFQIVNFVVMVFVLTRFFFKPVVRALDERSKRVTEALDEAERREREAAEMQTEYEKTLARAQEQVVTMQQQAQEDLQESRQRVLQEVREEIRGMREKTERELEDARQQAITQHRQELGHLATTLSGRLMHQAGGVEFQKASVDAFLERLSQIPADEYQHGLEATETTTVQVQVVSASELDSERRAQVEKQIGEVLERPIDMRYRVDPALIAGATLRFGDVVIDGSMAGQLQTLTDRYLADVGQEAT